METKAIISIFLFLFVRYSNGSDFKRVCYYGTWTNKLQVISGRFYIKDIDPYLCTHAVFAFAKVNTEKLRLQRLEVDDDNGLLPPKARGKYFDFTNMKQTNPKLVTLLSIGGATSSEALHNVAETPERRKTFAKNCLIYLRDRNFDGFDIDWEYPGAFKDKFTELLKAMRSEFDNDDAIRTKNKSRLVLSIAVAAEKPNIDESYNVTEIVKYVDFINVMAYDYFGTWSKVSGFTGPLFSRLSDPTYNPQLSQNWTIQYWMKKGAPPEKLVMGTTAAALALTLRSSSNHSIGAPVIKSTIVGPIRKLRGQLSYFELCDKVKGLREIWDDEQKYTYANYGNQWFAYNTPRSMIEKVKYAIAMGLGGIMFWTYDLDDFSGNHCGQGKFPLLNAIKSAASNTSFTRAPTTIALTIPPSQPARTPNTPLETEEKTSKIYSYNSTESQITRTETTLLSSDAKSTEHITTTIQTTRRPFVIVYSINKASNSKHSTLCDKVKGLRGISDDEQKYTYANSGNQWFAYNTPRSMIERVKFAKAMGLGGIMFWTYDLDDFSCGQGKFTLLNAIKSAASNTSFTRAPITIAITMPPSQPAEHQKNPLEREVKTSKTYSYYSTESQITRTETTLLSTDVESSDFKRVCYYGTWTNKLQVTLGRFYIKDIDPYLCTHAVFAFAKVNTEKLRLQRLEVDDDNGLLPPKARGKYFDFTNMKQTNPKLVTLLSIGGETSSEALHNVAETPERRKTFAKNCLIYLRDRNFDGFDIDWEYPGAFKDKFTELLKAMRTEFDSDDAIRTKNKSRLVLSIAVAAGKPNIDESYNVTEIVKYVDFINVMAYDYFGTWSKVSGFTGPLFSRLSDPTYNPQLSQNWTIQYWMKKGAPPEKLVMGITATALALTLRSSSNHGIGAPVINSTIVGPIRKLTGQLSYFENALPCILGKKKKERRKQPREVNARLDQKVKSIIVKGGKISFIIRSILQLCDKVKGLRGIWDDEQKYTYAHLRNQWFAYNTPRSMIEKVKYAKTMGLGGIMFWTYDLDDFSDHCGHGKFPLLNAIKDAASNTSFTKAPTTIATTTKAPTTIAPTTIAPTTPQSTPTRKPSNPQETVAKTNKTDSDNLTESQMTSTITTLLSTDAKTTLVSTDAKTTEFITTTIRTTRRPAFIVYNTNEASYTKICNVLWMTMIITTLFICCGD
ncbi:E3.2.1.14 [Mytilus coruscus]|uniref:E3.2.1.14 n=1 Tax=Mytilus coruscus TaxID=42192 RepID=A0A6J8C7S0_MYTCO|nr:E3.2.1.14 [Mytilus coruscus]